MSFIIMSELNNNNNVILDKYINKSKNPFNVIVVDGTYNNTNIHNDKKLETCLNMWYYYATNHIPIDLEIKGTEYKNHIINIIYWTFKM